MPAFIVDIIITLVKMFGIPFVMGLSWLKWIPKEFWSVLPALLDALKSAPDKPEAARRLTKSIEKCKGSFCPADTK